MSVLVIGGSGLIGGHVLTRLLNANAEVRCMTRHPKNLESFAPDVKGCLGDLLRSFSLSRCFKDTEKLFLISPVSRTETIEGMNAVAAAQATGIKKIVYISVPMPQGSTHIPQFRNKGPIEKAIKESGITYTIIRANNYFQNDFWGRAAVTLYDVYPQPIGHVGLNRVDVRDVADAATNALLSSDFDNTDYAIHGTELLTGDSVAEYYSRHFNKKIRYAGDDLEAWANQALHMMPNWMVQEFKIMYEYFQAHGLKARPEDLARQEQIIGHPPRDFDSFVTQLAQAWKD